MTSAENSGESPDGEGNIPTLVSPYHSAMESDRRVDAEGDILENLVYSNDCAMMESGRRVGSILEEPVYGNDRDVMENDRRVDAEGNVLENLVYSNDCAMMESDRRVDAEDNVLEYPMYSNDCGVMESDKTADTEDEGPEKPVCGNDCRLMELKNDIDATEDNDFSFDNDVEKPWDDDDDDDENFDTDILLLTESDIPGASLNGKHPSELNVAQLKRWLVCRGASANGKKPELIERVCDYIKYGWDVLLIDPDDGVNVRNKLQTIAAKHKNPMDEVLFQSIPKAKDAQWTKDLYKAPKVTFGTIYKFLVDRKVFLKKANYVEKIVERRESCSIKEVGNPIKTSPKDDYESIGYTRTLDKAYRFFQDGHVQNIRFHPMPDQLDYVCIGATVLPSMKKDKIYNVYIVLSQRTAHVEKAFCVCPAGLSGCCNHVTATLYCIEDYFHLKLNEDAEKGCTEKLQTWNQPRKKKVDARPIKLVTLMKKVYGVEKRPKVYVVNQWDCRPTSRRAVPFDRRFNLRKRLLDIDQAKKEAAVHAVYSATNDVEKKKAIEAQTMITRYGTSCFLQLLDDEPAPFEDRIQKAREERISRAKAMKLKLQQELCNLIDVINRDHSYTGSICPIAATHYEVDHLKASPSPYLVRSLYEEHICISPSRAIEIEACTRNQSLSNLWHNERKLRISASIMKTVCHRKSDTNVKTFITNKLSLKSINSTAIYYGRKNEDTAIECYIGQQKKRGIDVTVRKCGLFVNPAIPWLAATPDSVVEIGEDMGCLEVKCPFTCAKKSMAVVAAEQSSFCLQDNNGILQLKRSHQYFYQVQTQLFVTHLPWCDFVLWAPHENIHLERIFYDQKFVETAVSKARAFYFDVFLPSVIPYLIISESYEDCTTATSRIKENVSVKAESHATAPIKEKLSMKAESHYDVCDDVEILCVSTVNKPTPPTNVLQQLNCAPHIVYGDGNCLYYAIAHQAGYIEPSSHGESSVGQQLRMLALICMQKYPDVRTEEGMSQQQWEQKKLQVLQPTEWGVVI